MRNNILIQTITMSATVLIIGAGCSSNETHQPQPNAEPNVQVLIEEHNRLSAPFSRSNTTSAKLETRQKLRGIEAAQDAVVVANTDGHVASLMPHAMQPAQEIYGRADHEQKELHHGFLLPPQDHHRPPAKNTEKYQSITTNPIIRVADQSTSTFSIDVDTGAYSNMRRFLNSGQMPPADAVRVEELLNYFSYDYSAPDSLKKPFSIHTEVGTAPWNDKTRLLHIGLKGYSVDNNDRPPANLVFLLDVSGSMSDKNKLGLLKSSLLMLSKELTEKDSVSIVVYAGASGTVLEPTPGNDYKAIQTALKKLNAGGSTNGEAGIELAYSMAEDAMSEDSINRIILATDGDFNVGINDIDKLKSLIEDKRESGIALTTLGFGTGNYNDHLMEQLADVGNGNYAYIDTLSEARKVLSEELTSTLLTIAKDVKIQIEFNPAQVSEYRLLGYVNRHLANEDFANDKVDAGEIGSGHTVTALYEIALVGEGGARNSASRYQKNDSSPDQLNDEIAEVRLRFKQPDQNKSQLTSRVVSVDSLINDIENTSENFRFSAAVAGFGQLLRDNKYLNDFDFEDTAELAASSKGDDRFGYRAQFVQLVDLASSLHQQSVAANRVKDQKNEG